MSWLKSATWKWKEQMSDEDVGWLFICKSLKVEGKQSTILVISLCVSTNLLLCTSFKYHIRKAVWQNLIKPPYIFFAHVRWLLLLLKKSWCDEWDMETPLQKKLWHSEHVTHVTDQLFMPAVSSHVLESLHTFVFISGQHDTWLILADTKEQLKLAKLEEILGALFLFLSCTVYGLDGWGDLICFRFTTSTSSALSTCDLQ